MQLAPCSIRNCTPADNNFIYNSWLKSFREGSGWAKAMPAQIFFSNHKHVLTKILQDSSILIACNPDEPEQIFGYGVYQPSIGGLAVIHYIYVKHPYRRLGIGTCLLRTMLRVSDHNPDLPSIATHVTRLWEDSLQGKWNMIYNPYVLSTELFDAANQVHKVG